MCSDIDFLLSAYPFQSNASVLAMPLMELYNLQNHDITSSKFTFPTGSNYSVASRQLWGDSDLSE